MSTYIFPKVFFRFACGWLSELYMFVLGVKLQLWEVHPSSMTHWSCFRKICPKVKES